MPSTRCLRAPLIVISGVLMAVVASAGQASAADPVYPPPPNVQVLGTTASTSTPAQAVEVAGVTANAETGLAFTGSNAIGVGALGGLLLVGGATLVLTGKRRKDNA